MGLTRLCIQRPIALLMVIAAVLLLGWQARLRMPAELDPPVDIPVVNIATVFPGAGPEEVELRVSRPLEDAVATLSGVTEVTSRSLESLSFVTVELRLGSDLNAAAAEIRARVEGIRRELPGEIEPPQISRFDFNARPVMVLGVTGSRSSRDLRSLVEEEVRPRLSQVAGVGSVAVLGGLRREVQIQVDPDRLAARGLALTDLLRPLAAASQSAPAGAIVQGRREVLVRVLGEFQSLEELRGTPIPVPLRPPAGPQRGPAPESLVRLDDLAVVRDTVAPREQITRVGRRESIGLIVSRISDANTVEAAEGVRRELELLRGRLPPDVRISVLQDHAVAVEDALEDIYASLILGALLAVAVVWLFLHSLKDTVIVGCVIPTSIVATFLVMWAAGFSMNQMTMLALSLSVGILVDQSILVLECIHRHRRAGKPPFQAALDGRGEIGLADAANTFVDVIVFVPIAFMGGIVGQFFRQFGITIATATLLSLYVSFTLTPMLAARWLKPGEGLDRPAGGFARAFEGGYAAFEAGYRAALGWALAHRPAVVTAGFGSLLAVGFLAWQVVGFDFTPSVDRGQVSVQMELPPGASLEATDELMRRVEAEAAQIPEVDPDRMLASVGEILGGFGSLPDRGPQFGQLTLMLRDKQGFVDRLLGPFGREGRKRSDEQVARDLRERLRRVPGSDRLSVFASRGLTASLAPLQIGLYARDLEELEQVAEEVRHRLAALPELRNVDSSLRRGRPELQVRLDRERAEDLFVTPAELSAVVRTAVAGNTDLRYRERDQTYPIRLMVTPTGPGSPRLGPEALGGLVVAYRGPSPIYVADVAEVRPGAGPIKILRSQRTRRAIVFGQVREGVSLGAAQTAAEAALRGVALGSVERRWEGEVDDMQESALHMAAALILAVALSYLLLAALFNSLLHPFTIMLGLPMALVGALLALILTGTTMNIVSMIGIVMLVGLVSKNAILLVDYTNTLRGRGMDRNEAIRTAGPVRLRPILMTTLSTVIAMLPVAMQIGRASEMRSPMAVVVIGGLLLSTMLTLLVIPVMYTYLDDLTASIRKAWTGGGGAGTDGSGKGRPDPA